MYQCNFKFDYIDTFFLYYSNLKNYLESHKAVVKQEKITA